MKDRAWKEWLAAGRSVHLMGVGGMGMAGQRV